MESKFIGYDVLEGKSNIIGLFSIDNKEIKSVKKGERFLIATSETPFYPFGGGQEGDCGIILYKNIQIEVFTTQKVKKFIMHQCLAPNDMDFDFLEVTLKVNEEFRSNSSKAHTTDHMLHNGIKNVFGNYEYKGSYIKNNKFRFDFQWDKEVTNGQIKALEENINNFINEKHPVNVLFKPFSEIKSMGADYLEGITYPEIVRIIEIENINMVLCGGTHVKNTFEIKNFKVEETKKISESVQRLYCIVNF